MHFLWKIHEVWAYQYNFYKNTIKGLLSDIKMDLEGNEVEVCQNVDFKIFQFGFKNHDKIKIIYKFGHLFLADL